MNTREPVDSVTVTHILELPGMNLSTLRRAMYLYRIGRGMCHHTYCAHPAVPGTIQCEKHTLSTRKSRRKNKAVKKKVAAKKTPAKIGQPT